MLLSVAVVGLGGCSDAASDPDLDAGDRYVRSAAYRRAVLEQSLVNPANTYSSLRLASYHEERWGALPAYNPETARITGAATTGQDFARLEIAGVPWERDALIELGRQAFKRYPLRPRVTLGPLAAEPERYGGLVQDGQHAGLVWTVVADGRAVPSNTCATCHVASVGGRWVVGAANAELDMGAATGAALEPAVDRGWGAGRVDVTSDGVDNPVTTPDIRPVKYQTHLHRAGTVRNGLIALAIRLETLFITSHGEVIRPPRKLMFALALYLHSLAREPVADDGHPGASVFRERCAGCHGDDGVPGPPVPLDAVGTDDTVARSPERQTGLWRVPSLVGVGDRGALTASGAFRSLEALLEPDREGGHLFTQGLDAAQRDALLDYLRTY